MIEIVKTYPVMLCLYKRLEFTAYLRLVWKGWKIITIFFYNSAKGLVKHHQFNIFWPVFVFHCSGNPVMHSSNIAAVFIPTGFQEERTRLLKPLAILNTLDSDDPNVFCTNFFDRYVNRTDELENTCYSDFIQITNLQMPIKILNQIIWKVLLNPSQILKPLLIHTMHTQKGKEEL